MATWGQLVFKFLGASMLLVLTSTNAFPDALSLSPDQEKKWARFWEEHQGHRLIMRFSEEYQPRTLALVGVHVIPMTGQGLLQSQTVIVEGGKIAAIGPDSEVRPPKGANVITPVGLYLIPGLTEAHSHTIVSLEQFLVYLTRGVTTLREMDGWPWMLRAKHMAAANELLIPNLYVAGHILSHKPFEFFMTKIDAAETARRTVEKQVEDGYDFIKIHTSMPESLYVAVMEAARAKGLDVVGHVPVEISLETAVRTGMRTGEHFTGYRSEETFEINEVDSTVVQSAGEFWNVPTFATYHDHLRGDEAWSLAEAEGSTRLVPRWLRKFWYRVASGGTNELGLKLQKVYPQKREIFERISPWTDRFLAGTDTGTYSFIVPGYALQEEVRIFEELGFSPHQALKTATVNPSIAFRKEDEFGTIEVGKRADFVILNTNPLAGTQNLADIWGVCVRGVWLHHDALQWIEDSLQEAFSEENPIPAASTEAFWSLILEMEDLHEKGFPYPDYALEEIETFYRSLELEEMAARIEALQQIRGVPIPTP